MKASERLRLEASLGNNVYQPWPMVALKEAADLLEECERAFESLAALNDRGANDRLAATGSYGSFDEPGAVQVSRSMLARLRGETNA